MDENQESNAKRWAKYVRIIYYDVRHMAYNMNDWGMRNRPILLLKMNYIDFCAPCLSLSVSKSRTKKKSFDGLSDEEKQKKVIHIFLCKWIQCLATKNYYWTLQKKSDYFAYNEHWINAWRVWMWQQPKPKYIGINLHQKLYNILQYCNVQCREIRTKKKGEPMRRMHKNEFVDEMWSKVTR